MTVLSLLFILMVLPAAIGYYLYSSWLGQLTPGVHLWPRNSRRSAGGLGPGDYLIYRKPKVSPRPGPRARNVHPSEKGDDYSYEVDKFWTVADVLEDGRLVARTRTGKQVCLTPEDRHLRRPGLIERLRYHGRFPAA